MLWSGGGVRYGSPGSAVVLILAVTRVWEWDVTPVRPQGRGRRLRSGHGLRIAAIDATTGAPPVTSNTTTETLVATPDHDSACDRRQSLSRVLTGH